MKIYKVYNKQNILIITFFITTLFLLLFFSKQNFESVKNSTTLFINSVFPSLFPFFLFTELILNSNTIDVLVQYFGNIISKIFKINKNSSPAIIIGFLCGYPMGAKVVSELYEQNKISSNDAKRLLLFVNNCNPIFIISTIGISIFENLKIGIILFISHFLSSVIIGIISVKFNNILNTKRSKNNNFDHILEKKNDENLSFFDILKKSVIKSFFTLSNILGFIIIFNLLFDNLNTIITSIIPNDYISCFLSGLFEVTRGCKDIASIKLELNYKLCLISFILGFSGLCILCQIYSCIYKQKFRFKELLISKITQGTLSSFITYIFLRFINLNAKSNIQVFNNESATISYSDYLNNIKETYLISILILFIILFLFIILYNSFHNTKKS